MMHNRIGRPATLSAVYLDARRTARQNRRSTRSGERKIAIFQVMYRSDDPCGTHWPVLIEAPARRRNIANQVREFWQRIDVPRGNDRVDLQIRREGLEPAQP